MSNEESLQNQLWQQGEVGGPQFKTKGKSLQILQKKLAHARTNGWAEQISRAIRQNKRSVVLALIATAILSAGLYFAQSAGNDAEKIGVNDISASVSANAIRLTEEGLVAATDGEAIKSSQGQYAETAEQGDGITHLARRALQQYLQDTGNSLTAEQKIYAEDYIQNATGSYGLEIGEEISFSPDLIEESVQAAQNLEDWQIENLKQYI